jgi:hypothetical protein
MDTGVCVCVSEREGRTETKCGRKGKFTHRKNFICYIKNQQDATLAVL